MGRGAELIVGAFFQGDDDTEVAWKQHDVYHQGLGILIGTCNRLAQFAKLLLDDKTHLEWGSVRTCDHRTLQGAHDLLAAAWRFRNVSRQGSSPFDRETRSVEPESLWLEWLGAEVANWVEHPSLVRNVQLILANQNQQLGYIAESSLCLGILDRYPDVPWKPEFRAAYTKDLAKNLQAEVRLRTTNGTELPMKIDCECTAMGHLPCNSLPCKTAIAQAARESWGLLD